jgi:hypothetical protein
MGLNTGLGGHLAIIAALAFGRTFKIGWDGSSFFKGGESATFVSISFSGNKFKF